MFVKLVIRDKSFFLNKKKETDALFIRCDKKKKKKRFMIKPKQKDNFSPNCNNNQMFVNVFVRKIATD